LANLKDQLKISSDSIYSDTELKRASL